MTKRFGCVRLIPIRCVSVHRKPPKSVELTTWLIIAFGRDQPRPAAAGTQLSLPLLHSSKRRSRANSCIFSKWACPRELIELKPILYNESWSRLKPLLFSSPLLSSSSSPHSTKFLWAMCLFRFNLNHLKSFENYWNDWNYRNYPPKFEPKPLWTEPVRALLELPQVNNNRDFQLERNQKSVQHQFSAIHPTDC